MRTAGRIPPTRNRPNHAPKRRPRYRGALAPSGHGYEFLERLANLRKPFQARKEAVVSPGRRGPATGLGVPPQPRASTRAPSQGAGHVFRKCPLAAPVGCIVWRSPPGPRAKGPCLLSRLEMRDPVVSGLRLKALLAILAMSTARHHGNAPVDPGFHGLQDFFDPRFLVRPASSP
jgi:hypothetical protein